MERGGEVSAADPTDPAVARHPMQLDVDTTRVRIARELFGVDMAAPRIGRFHVLEKLGEGGMGEVYTAFDPELDRRVAIKVLHAAYGDSHERRERLLREAQALARVSHPNIVQVFEVGVHHGHVFVAMEYVRGESLAQRLARKARPHDWKSVLQLFIAAGHGLAAVHAVGLVHRDFKPANTMIGEDGRARILDFGLARVTASGDHHVPRAPSSGPDRLDESLTAMGSVVGTPAYMAPEVLMGQRADARADQYSFCTALFEGLYGYRPHAGETLAALAETKLSGSLRPPPMGTKVPAWLHAAVVRGLALAPQQRWPSMPALIAELSKDRRSVIRRWSMTIVSLVLLGLTVVAVQQGIAQQRVAAGERARAELAERDVAAQQERVRRSTFERSVMAEAERAAEVMRLAKLRGRERDALVLGIQTLAPHAPEFSEAPFLALDGLAEALPAMIPSRTIPGRGGRILTMALSADGRSLAAVDTDAELTLWNADDGTLRASAPSSGKTAELAFSPDGAALLINSDRCAIHDTRTGTPIREVASCLYGQFSRDSMRLYGFINDPKNPAIAAIDLASGAELFRIPAPADVEGLMLDPAGRTLVAVTPDGDLRIHAASDGRPLAVRAAPGGWKPPAGSDFPRFSRLAFSHDGKQLAVGGGGGVHLWDLERGRHLGKLIEPGDEWWVNLTFSQDSNLLFTSSSSEVRVFDTATAKLLTMTPSGNLTNPTVLGDGYILATTSDGRLERWDESGVRIDYTRADEATIMGLQLAVSANQARAATGRDEIRLWDLGDRRTEAGWRLRGTPSEGLYTGSAVVTEAEGVVHVHDRRSGEVIARFTDNPPAGADEPAPHLRKVHLFENKLWSRRGDRLRMHDIVTGRLVMQQHRSWAPNEASWLTTGGSPRLASMRPDGALDVFDARTEDLRCTVRGEGERMRTGPGRPFPYIRPAKVALSRDGQHIAIPAGDHDEDSLVTGLTGTLRISIWSTDTCKPLGVIVVPHQGPLRSPLLELAFAQDGSLVTRLGTTTFIHDPASGIEKFRADESCSIDPRQPEGLSELSPDGTTLLTSCGDQAIVWPLSGEDPTVIEADLGQAQYYYKDAYATGQRRLFFGDSQRVLLPADPGGLFVWDIASASLDIRISARGTPLSDANVALDGESIEHHDYTGTLRTYAASRRAVIVATCRALKGTEVWDEVATQCGLVSPRPTGRG